MKLITSEVDAEADKWQERDSEIIRRAKNMSSMAFSMYLFTRGEGALMTTQDLFTQADYFAEEGTKLFHVVRQFSAQVTHQRLIPVLITTQQHLLVLDIAAATSVWHSDVLVRCRTCDQ